MPFENVQQLETSRIPGVGKLSEREKRIFMEAFNQEAYGGSSEEDAIKAAWGAVKRQGGGGDRGAK